MSCSWHPVCGTSVSQLPRDTRTHWKGGKGACPTLIRLALIYSEKGKPLTNVPATNCPLCFRPTRDTHTCHFNQRSPRLLRTWTPGSPAWGKSSFWVVGVRHLGPGTEQTGYVGRPCRERGTPPTPRGQWHHGAGCRLRSWSVCSLMRSCRNGSVWEHDRCVMCFHGAPGPVSVASLSPPQVIPASRQLPSRYCPFQGADGGEQGHLFRHPVRRECISSRHISVTPSLSHRGTGSGWGREWWSPRSMF